MNGSPVRRFAWKEYRVLRAFWISLALMAIAGQLFVLLFLHETTLLAGLFGVALIAVALYALGNGATMFATEREEETYDLLRVLPVTDGQVVLGKLVFSVTSVIAIAVVLLTSAWVLAGWRVPAPVSHRQLWAIFGLGALELLVWGIFFSLLSSRPLQAAILGVVATSASVSALVYLDGNGRLIHTLPVYVNVVPMRLTIVAVMAAIDLGLAMRWLRPLSETRRGGNSVLAKWWSREREDVVAPTATSGRASLAHLTWHAWRQSWSIYAWVLSGVLIMAALIWDPTMMSSYAAMVMLAGASLVGTAVFLGDQEKSRYRFFAEHGVSARRVWLSRQVLGLAMVVVLATIGAAVAMRSGVGNNLIRLIHGPSPFHAERSIELAEWMFFVLAALPAAMVLAYTSGQLFSMLLRNGLLAGFFGLLLTVPVCVWAILMVRYRFNPLWSVLPVPISLLLATWLRAPDWVSERNSWRGWLSVGLVVAVPFVSVATVSAWNRVHEIPEVDVGFDVAAFVRPRTQAQRETADIYREAGALLKPYGVEKGATRETPSSPIYQNTPLGERELDWLEGNAPALAMAREASARMECMVSDPGKADFRHPIEGSLPTRMGALGLLLVVAGREREQRDDLAGALDDYLAALRLTNHLRNKGNWLCHREADRIEPAVHARLSFWSSHAQQTPELIQHALTSIDRLDAQRPPPSDAIQADYVYARRVCSADIDALQNGSFSASQVRSLTLTSLLTPWELTRSQRLLDLVAKYELQVASHVEQQLRSGSPPTSGQRSLWWGGLRHYYHLMLGSAPDQLDHRKMAAFIPQWLSNTPNVELTFGPYVHRHFHWFERFRLETQRRAIRIVLAVQLWRLEHGELPGSLDELAGETLDALPIDPFTGEPFRYFPEGVADAGWYPRFRYGRLNKVAPGMPMIWSPGWYLEQEQDGGSEEDEVIREVRWHRNMDRGSISDREAISHGWAFPILTSK